MENFGRRRHFQCNLRKKLVTGEALEDVEEGLHMCQGRAPQLKGTAGALSLQWTSV